MLTKSRCLIFESACKADSFINPEPVFYIESFVIEIVNQWPHLGDIINNRSDDDADISFMCNSMVGQINSQVAALSNAYSSFVIQFL